MNTQLRHVAVVAAILIAVLIGATTYWQSWEGGALANRQGNAVQLVAQLQVDRGTIFAANGTRLAWSVRRHHKHGLTTFTRQIPAERRVAPQVVGYATTGARADRPRAVALNDYLTGSNTTLSEHARAGARPARRQDDSRKQRHAHDPAGGADPRRATPRRTLRRRRRARTRRRAPCSRWPRRRRTTRTSWCRRNGYAKVAKIKGTCGDASALYDNATQGLYPPGSTFKLVTASAALDSGAYTPTSPFDDPGYCIEYGQIRSTTRATLTRQAGSEGVRERHALQRRSSTRSTPSSATSACGSAQRRSSTTRGGTASTPPRRSTCRRTRSPRAGSTSTAGSSPRRIPRRSMQGGSLSDRSTWSSRRSRWRSSQRRSRTAARSRCRISSTRSSLPTAAIVSKTTPQPARRSDQAVDGRRAEPDDAARRDRAERPRASDSPRVSTSPGRPEPPSWDSATSTTRGSSASRRPTTRATSSPPWWRSNQTDSAPPSQLRSPRSSSKSCWAADHVSNL